MYEIKREDGRVTITKGMKAQPIFSAPGESYVVFIKDGHPTAIKVKDLPDADLLLALASAIELKV